MGLGLQSALEPSDAATTDRTSFDPKAFYALADPQGTVHIRWMEAVPADWKVLGRLTYTLMPHVVKPGAAAGFAEFSDDFEF